MIYIYGFIVVALLYLIFYEGFYGYHFNVSRKGCNSCDTFNVHPIYGDSKEASLLMDKVDKKNTKTYKTSYIKISRR